MLFFDDGHLYDRQNTERRVGSPQLVPEGVFVDPQLDVHSGYPSVFRDPDSGVWRCLYQGGPIHDGEEGYVAAVAESDDGVHWETPDLSCGGDDFPRRVPHQVIPSGEFFEWAPAYFDGQAEDPGERIKGLVCCWAEDRLGHDCLLYASADGRSWKRPEGARWHPHGIDPAACVFWNEFRSSYCIAARPSVGDRRVAIYETRDWRSFSKPELLLQADALDTPAAELYGMTVFPYEGMFVGFLWVYHTPPEVSAAYSETAEIDGPIKFLYGTIDCQLIYSYNGWHFQRGLRDPFIANSEPGQHGAGLVHASSMVVTEDDRIRVYSSSFKGEHGEVSQDPSLLRESAILLHELRLDGFCYLESEGEAGSMTTRIVYWKGGELQINVKASEGEIRVQVEDAMGKPLTGYGFDDAVSFAGDELYWTPQWKDGKSMAQVAGQVVRFSVRLTDGSIYAMRGDFAPVGPYDYQKFKSAGSEPRALDAYFLDNAPE